MATVRLLAPHIVVLVLLAFSGCELPGLLSPRAVQSGVKSDAGAARFEIVGEQSAPLPPVSFALGWGSTGSGPGQFRSPRAAAHGPGVDLYVVDQANHRIHRCGSAGTYVGEWGRFGKREGEFVSPTDVAVDVTGDAVYVVDATIARVQKFTADGTFLTQWGSPGTGQAQLLAPGGLDVGLDGDVFVADTSNRRVQRFTAEGAFVAMWSTGTGPEAFPRSLATTGAGEVFVLLTEEVVVYTSEGAEVHRWNGTSAGTGFQDARGIDVDQEGRVLVADTVRSRILAFTRQGELLSRWGEPGSADGASGSGRYLDGPAGVAHDAAGNVYVTDTGNDRVQVFSLR